MVELFDVGWWGMDSFLGSEPNRANVGGIFDVDWRLVISVLAGSGFRFVGWDL